MKRLATLVLLAACGGDRKLSVAVLSDGIAERAPAASVATWDAAQPGSPFFLGDSARTAAATAAFTLTDGRRLKLEPNTILRFGWHSRGDFELQGGALELEAGTYEIQGGRLDLASGRVRLEQLGGQLSVALLSGSGTLTKEGSPSETLLVGTTLNLDLPVAAVPPPEVPPDATRPDRIATPSVLTILAEIAGRKATIKRGRDGDWQDVASTLESLAEGDALRLGAKTTARLKFGATSFDLAAGSAFRAASNYSYQLDAGSGTATAGEGEVATVRVPGGTVTIDGASGGASAEIAITGDKATVRALAGTVKVSTPAGRTDRLNAGDAVAISESGEVQILSKIPDYFEFRLPSGESAVVHDPSPATAIRFDFGGGCASQPGTLELSAAKTFSKPQLSAGTGGANLLVPAGSWFYRVRCSGADGGAGRLSVRRDSGSRPLPKRPPTNTLDASGQKYVIPYQTVIPNLIFRWKEGGPGPYKFSISHGGKTETFQTQKPLFEILGTELKEGAHVFGFARAAKKSPTSSLVIQFDNSAPQVFIDKPVPGIAWGSNVDVAGSVVPGWKVSYEGTVLPLDKSHRFAATVSSPSSRSVAIKVSHPDRGVHYYLRRPVP